MKKVAIVTDDAAQRAAHFGRASHYLVLTVDEGREVARELRDKHTHHHRPDHDHDHQEEHDHQTRHQQMLAPIHDCQVLIAGPIGIPMVRDAEAQGMEVLLTRVKTVDEIIEQLLAGTLAHEAGLAHWPSH